MRSKVFYITYNPIRPGKFASSGEFASSLMQVMAPALMAARAVSSRERSRMAFQTVFKRYELKYMLSLEQKAKVLEAMSPYMELDKYGRTTIRNIYFDTDNYRLIRRSIEKPAYKEKLRIRSYSRATKDSTVFVELKKKYEKVVYKRRLPLCEADAMAWVCRERACPFDTQISREIDYFIDFYGKLKPTVFLSYEREAYYAQVKEVASP